jgi:outer membrane beta-barrel protein
MKVLRLAALLSVPASLSAMAANPAPPPSFVENYRVESHYGAGDAVLNPIFGHDERLEVSLGALYQPVSSLVNYGAWTGSLTWHINRRHAVEPIYFGQIFGPRFTSFVDEQIIAKKTGAPELTTEGVETPKQLFAASYLFSPFYAKMHITEQNVAHFDVYFGLGAGAVKTELAHLDGSKGFTKTRGAASIAAGIRFLFPQHFALRLELRDFVYASENFGKTGVGNNFQLGASASLFLF